LLAYSATAAIAAVPLFSPGGRGPSKVATRTLAVAAVGLHFAGLLAFAGAFGIAPLFGLAPALSSLALLVGLLALGTVWLTSEISIVLVAFPLAIVPLAIALLAGFRSAPVSPPAEGGWFILHTALSLLGIALLAVAFAAAFLYLVQHRQLKERRFGVMFQFVPPLEQLDRLNHIALLAGLPALTVGVALAVGFADRSGGGLIVNPAHLGWGLGAWAVVSVITALRLSGRLRGKKAAHASVIGFAVIALAYLVLLAFGDAGTRFL
jgi:ABC-type uncharacterized transport system permease subunit